MLNITQLNEAQRKAVMHGEGPLLVLAGPGSGKTFTITQRILYLIETMHVSPEEILVITFTKESALSMQRRFKEQSKQAYPVNFGTFHSVFYHILNQSQGSNRSHKKQILCESQKKHLLYPIVRKYANQKSGNMESLSEEVAMLLSAISFYKNTDNFEEAICKLSQEWRGVFGTIYKEYESIRKQKNAVDFDDMVCECADLLEKDAQMRSYWQKRFAHILMDEFQDINPMQYRVIKLLTRTPYNLFAVGDDDQAIYGFRGSQPACLKQFREEYKAEQVLLNVNYRSREEIVKASLLVIQENKDRFHKKLVAQEANLQSSEKHVCIKTFQEREEQYQYLITYFAAKNDTETDAVLFRTNSYMQGFAIRLQREGVAFVMKEKSESIYESALVKDIMAYLRVASGEENRELWLRILNKPSRYISRDALAQGKLGDNNTMLHRIKSYYANLNTESYSFLHLDKIRTAVNILEKQLMYLKKVPPYLGVQYIRKVIGYEKYVKEQYRGKRNGEQRFAEAMEMLEWLAEDAKGYASVEEWINAQERYNQSVAENGNIHEKNTDENKSNIQLMTVHASKGLEFDRVWIPDCNEKIFPHGTMLDKKTCEEERRIFYVGMTRAKKDLELLCTTGTKERPRLISRFLNPLWKHYSSSPTTSSNSH